MITDNERIQDELMEMINKLDNLPYNVPKDIEEHIDNAYNELNEAYVKLVNSND